MTLACKRCGGSGEEPAKRKPRKVSPKKAREQRAERATPLPPFCRVNSPVCTRRAQGWHHVLKKSAGGNHRTPRIPACNPCNVYVEDHPTWAKAHGFVLSGHRHVGAMPEKYQAIFGKESV